MPSIQDRPGLRGARNGGVTEGHAGDAAEVREYMSGNLCRCGAYKGITDAVMEARDATVDWAESS